MLRKAPWITGVLVLALAPSAPASAQNLFEVTITNLTRSQTLTPPVLATHEAGFQLFVPGEAASPELFQLAEDGVTDPLVALLETIPEVHNVAVGDAVPPGGSVTLEIEGGALARYLSAAGMLATTNDGFFSVRGVELPKRGGISVYATVYDAGSEGNSELCDHIPGPPCNNPGVRFTDEAEGFIHVHSGIHDLADLGASEWDWRNPAALIEIRRVP